MLTSEHGRQYTETALAALERHTKSMDSVHTSFHNIHHFLTSLNPVLYSLRKYSKNAQYWIDSVDDWSSTLFDTTGMVKIDKIGASSIPLNQLANSVKARISEILVMDATTCIPLQVDSETRFLIRFHKIVRTLADHTQQIHSNISEMRVEIEQLIAQNNDYQITTLAQISAIKHRNLIETKRIVQESINPRLNLAR